jgi:hypothetical protein
LRVNRNHERGRVAPTRYVGLERRVLDRQPTVLGVEGRIEIGRVRCAGDLVAAFDQHIRQMPSADASL